MVKRPMCLLCFLMVLSLGTLELMGIPLIRGNPLPVNVQEQIEAHPGSMICGEVEQYGQGNAEKSGRSCESGGL